MDAWCDIDTGDEQHPCEWPHERSRETAGNGDRFDISTRRATVVADGSSPDVFGVRAAPSVDVVAWLRARPIPGRASARGTPPPMPALERPLPVPAQMPPLLLQPRIRVEPLRAALWPVLAVSVGLATALFAAVML